MFYLLIKHRLVVDLAIDLVLLDILFYLLPYLSDLYFRKIVLLHICSQRLGRLFIRIILQLSLISEEVLEVLLRLFLDDLLADRFIPLVFFIVAHWFGCDHVILRSDYPSGCLDHLSYGLGSGQDLLLCKPLIGDLVLIMGTKLLHSRRSSFMIFQLISHLHFRFSHLNLIAIFKALAPVAPVLLLFFLLLQEGADSIFLLLEGHFTL